MTKVFLAAIGFFLLVYILPLGVRPLTIPDETRYAEIPREMIVSGDWIVPHLNGLRYFEKPVLGYWLNAISLRVFGENAFAVRLPSALAAGISALAIFLLARNFGGGTAVGFTAAGVFLTSVLVFAVGVFPVLDTVFTMFVTACMVSLFHATQTVNPRARMKWSGLGGVFCGMAFLVKGFLGFVLPVIAFLPFLLWQRRWRDLLAMPWIPLAAASAVILPWAMAIHLREVDFWHNFFWVENVERFLSAKGHQQHLRPFWFFVPVLAAGMIPWTFLLGAAIRGVRREHLGSPVVRFCICWLVVPFVFFSISKGKLATYVLPCIPPLAVLVAIGVTHYLESGRRKAFVVGAVLSAAFAGILGVTVTLSQTTSLLGFKYYSVAETWKWSVGVLALAAWCVASVSAARVRVPNLGLALYGVSPALFLLCAHFIIPDRIHRDRVIPVSLILDHRERIRPESIVMADADDSTAVCWLLKRDDVRVFNSGGELTYGLSHSDAKRRLVPMERLGQFILENREKRNVVLIDEVEDYARWKATLPEPSFEEAAKGFVFVEY